MFGLGFSEVLVILAVALIFIGPDKLPELAQKLGRFIWQVKHTAEELRREIALPEFQKEYQAQKELLNKELGSLEQETGSTPASPEKSNESSKESSKEEKILIETSPKPKE